MQCKPEIPLGVRSKSSYQTVTIALGPGDGVFVVSDGVVEAMNAEGELYGIERLDADLADAAGTSAADLVRKVANNVNTFTGSAPKADDVTALAMRWRPARTA
jgi:sigma-B regulation protein RsbU (phosphoserine phosphatase)